MYELSLANLTVADAGPLALLDAAAAAGFDCVNMWLVPPPAMADINLKCAARESVVGNAGLIRDIASRVEATGVRVFEASCGWLSPNVDRAATAPVLETMAQIGTQRLSLVGWDADRSRLCGNLASLCADAETFGITVTLEFMPYSAVRTVADAADVLAAVGAPNLDVLVDALHLARSGGTPSDVKQRRPEQIGVFQLCDAPAAGPPADRLRDESVNHRLYPGDGELPLAELLAVLPSGVVVEVEIPSAADAAKPVADRAQIAAARSRSFLNTRGKDDQSKRSL